MEKWIQMNPEKSVYFLIKIMLVTDGKDLVF